MLCRQKRATPYSKVMLPTQCNCCTKLSIPANSLHTSGAPAYVNCDPCKILFRNTVEQYCSEKQWQNTVEEYRWWPLYVNCNPSTSHVHRWHIQEQGLTSDYASKLTIIVTRTSFFASSAIIICNNHHNPHNVTIYVTMCQRIKAHSYRDTNQVFIQFCYYATMWIVYIPTLTEWVRRLPNLSYWLQALIMTKSIDDDDDTL